MSIRPINQDSKTAILRHQREVALDAHAEAEAHIGFLTQQIAIRDQRIAEQNQRIAELEKVLDKQPTALPTQET